MHWHRLAEALLLPPGCLFWLAGAGLLLVLRRVRAGIPLLMAGLGSLYLLSTPLAAGLLLDGLDRYPQLVLGEDRASAGAVVVLGAGLETGTRSGGGDEISGRSVERLTYGAALSLELGVPLMISGKLISEGGVSMLADRFELSPRWVEAESRNTRENAEFSADLLWAAGIRRAYLVTDFYHLPRAVAAFDDTGFGIVPAPMGFAPPGSTGRGIAAALPRADSFRLSSAALHEMCGRLWYRMSYGI